MLSFWRWLYKFSGKKLREAFIAKYYHDRQCPNCKQWISTIGGGVIIWNETIKREIFACENCGHESYWVPGPGVSFHDEDFELENWEGQ